MQINRPETEIDRIDECVCALAETFDRRPTDAMLTGYQLGLTDVPVDAIEAATAKAMKTCKFMPKPVELREPAGEAAPEQRAVLAWQVVADNAWLGPYKHIDFDDPLINATIRSMGGWVSLLDRPPAEFDKWARKEFIDTYTGFMRSGVDGEACHPLPGLSDIGEHQVRRTDGTVRTINLGGPTLINTGLPALPGVERYKIATDSEHIPKIELRRFD